MDTSLLMIGLGAGILFIVFSIWQVVRGKTGVGFLATLLVTAALVATLLALYLPTAPASDARLPAIGLGVGLALVGLVVLRLERRNGLASLGQSRGLLGAGVGVLLLVGVFVGPLIMDVTPTPTPPTVAAPQGMASDADSVNLTAFSNDVAAVDTPVAPGVSPTPPSVAATTTPLPPRPALPTPTPTNTPVQLATRDAEDSVEEADDGNAAPAGCVGIVQNNLNLRTEPGVDGALQTTIPSGTSVSVDGANADGWLSVTYGQMSGWVSGDYVLLGASCASLPAQTG